MRGFSEWILALKGFPLRQAEKDLEAFKLLSAQERSEWQQKAKWDIARFHFEQNPLYRKRVGKSLPTSWNELPILEKKDYQRPMAEMISAGLRERDLYIGNTSGSSGHPFWYAKTKDAHARTWAVIKQRYGWHGLSLSSFQARFYGIPMERVGYTKEKIKDFLLNRVRFPVFDLSDPVLAKFERRFTRKSFDYVYGYTNSQVLFARYLERKGIVLKNICPSLKLCMTTSEVCTPEDRAILSRAFDVPVINEYGASEVGLIAFETSSNEWLISEENIFVEVVNEKGELAADGQAGALLVTDLFNRAMPFIRYKVGDIGIVKSSENDRPFNRKRIVSLEGRLNDTVILPGGKRSAGMTLYYVSRSILESSGILREFIIRQTELTTFEFDIVTDRALTDSESLAIRKKVELYFGAGLQLKLNRVAVIQRPASGKIKHFYSELSQ